MADLVLRAKLDLLRRNLAVVEDVLTVIEERFRPEPAAPAGVDEQLSELLVALRTLEAEIELTVHPTTLDELVRAKDLARSVARSLRSHSAVTSERSDLLPTGHDLDEDLVQKAEAASIRIEELEQQIDEHESPEATEALWDDFHQLESDCRQLFNEYVDLVRGVALRSSGVDRDLCLIADDLVRIVGRKWRSITVPSRRERMRSTSGRIIRIGFPEWTIWNLPVVAHEYGHVYAEAVDELGNLIDEIAREVGTVAERRRVESLLADAFAAVTVGPAYGCAAMLTRLDVGGPRRGSYDAELITQRAGMILASLETSLEQQSAPIEAVAMVERLRAEWADAVAGTGYAGEAATLHPRSEEIITAVSQQTVGIKFPYERWTDFVTERRSALRSLPDSEGEIDVRQSRDVDIRHLLNAAWLCRVPPAAEAHLIVTEPSQLEAISERVRLTGLSWLDSDAPASIARHGHQTRRAGVQPTWNE